MESHCPKCMESTNGPLYNIRPLPGSVQFVLASPDTEKAGQTLPRPQIPASPFLHQVIVQSGHKTSSEQLLKPSIRSRNSGLITLLLHKAVAAPSCSLLAEIPPFHCGSLTLN